jgi:uncharacterized protein (DUF488 family)
MTRMMSQPVLAIWTVGHSNHEFDRFSRLLMGEQIEYLVDVRSYPYSRYAPQYGREELQTSVSSLGIGYVYLGVPLGGRPDREEHYDQDGHALYRVMSQQEAFTDAIHALIRGSRRHRLALMCSEADPEHCHRRLLVGKVLAEHGVQLRHIMPDGAVLAEDTVKLQSESAQCSLLAEEVDAWRSTQSVSHRRRLSTSSAA